jgi:hypothetical protein
VSVADSAEAAAAVAAIQTMINGVMADSLPIAQHAVEHTVALMDPFGNDISEFMADIINHSRVNLPRRDDSGPLDWSAVEDIVNDSTQGVSDVAGDIAKIVDTVETHTQSLIAGLLPDVTESIAGALRAFAELVSGLLGSLTEDTELWTNLLTQAVATLQDHDPGLLEWASRTAGRIGHDIANSEFLPHEGLIILDDIPDETKGPASDTVEGLLNEYNQYPAFIKSILNAVGLILSAFSLASAGQAAHIAGVQQAALSNQPTTPLSPPELATLLRRQEIGEGFAKDHAKRSGLSPELFQLLSTLTRSFLTSDNYVEMWRRTGDDSELAMLRKLGIEDEDIDRLKTIALGAPTPTDIVRFMVRDVFDAGAIATGGLDQEFDQKINNDWNRVAGISADTLKLYWMAHWQLPSPTMFYEMFHRGFITDVEMADALKLADYAPGWVQHMIDINYNVPGRIDVRRMWEAGIITTHEELVKRHADMGYSPADAETLATFVEAITARTKAREAEATRAPIVRAIIEEYGKGVLAYDLAHADLVALGLDDEHATYRLQQGIFEREQDRGQRIRASVGREYVAGFLNESDARDRLDKYGIEANEQDSLLDSWNLDRELRELSEEKRHQRDLTKGEVVQSYADGILDPADTAAHLTALGYDGEEAATLIHLEDARLARRDATATEAAVRTAYVGRQLDETGARDRLTAAGFSQRRIDDRLTQWTIQREQARPDISAGQLERMLMLGVVPQDRLAEILSARGYTDEDASLLLTLWGTEMAVNQATIDERRREFDVREQRLNAAQEAARQALRGTADPTGGTPIGPAGSTAGGRAGQQAFTTARDATAFERRLQQQHDQQSNANVSLRSA